MEIPPKAVLSWDGRGGASERWQGLTLEGPRVRSKQRQQATRRDSGGQSILLRTRTRTRIEEDWVNKLGLVKDEGYTNYDPVWSNTMRLYLALLLVGGILAEDEDCPDFDCPVKDGSFAVSTSGAYGHYSQAKTMVMITPMTPGPLHMPSVLRLHRLPPSQAALPFWPLLGRYQVRKYQCLDVKIWFSYLPFILKGNTARTRTRQFVVRWHRPLPHLPQQHPLTRNTKDLLSIGEPSFLLAGLRNATQTHVSFLGATAAPPGLRSPMVFRLAKE